MSALRLGIREDGTRDVRAIDDGVTVRRRVIGRYSTLGGSLEARPTVDFRTLFPATTPARRAQTAAYRARQGETR